MQGEGFLLAIAQIAVTLAGFSGLVLAIRGAPPTTSHLRDTRSLSWMFGTSLRALFMALLPLLLASFRLPDRLVWTVGTLVMGVFMIVFGVAMALSGRRLTRLGHRPRVRYFPMADDVPAFGVWFFVGFGSDSSFGGLIVCLLMSALSLVVFLVVLARAAGTALIKPLSCVLLRMRQSTA